MNGFEPVRRCVFEYTDAGNNGRVLWDQSVDEIESENSRLKKENEELRTLANIDAKLLFLVGMCPYIDCGECDAKELCDEAIYLEGIYGIDKDLCGDERNSHETKGDIR